MKKNMKNKKRRADLEEEGEEEVLKETGDGFKAVASSE